MGHDGPCARADPERDARIPVSYTHLDVYKRQKQIRGVSARRGAKGFPHRRIKQLPVMTGLFAIPPLLRCFLYPWETRVFTVSYTHLHSFSMLPVLPLFLL